MNSSAGSIGDGFDVRSLAVTFRDGHHLHAHAHPWAQLVYARSGVMHVTAEGRVWFVPPTRAIWIPAGVEHEIGVRGEVALRTLYISAERAGGVKRNVEALEVSPLLGELIMHILAAGMLDPAQAGHDRLAGVLMDLIASARGVDLALPLPRDPRALKLAEQLRADPADKRDLEELAAECGASLRTLQRCFSDETSLTIEAWRQKARLVHSAAALAAGASVTGAALDCGYDSPSAFIAAFRRQFGVTPGKFNDV
jgi:AraC-like DNA-binding protein/mannose-6-phosphate isomerase-like protein (cupin superfamily)